MRLASLYLLFALALPAAKPDPLPSSPADLAHGQKLFRNYCGLCHGPIT